MVSNLCCWNILLGFRCYHCAWSSKLVECSGTKGKRHLSYWNFIHKISFYCQILLPKHDGRILVLLIDSPRRTFTGLH
jgi:hypothetical protein